ncbi:unnamed protein product [Hymenolepis diminuta]|uniref:F-box/kelch-repeat protein n=1 Tax=Hymenolepis diminuta TaxID=6216 RepID=A0A0R3SWJ5_HYMDI|nr:unnamed protein product [Hymenolepis diminuta]
MRRSGKGVVGGGEKWQWLPYIPMNNDHGSVPLAVYFQGRVYVLGLYENVNMTASGQWTNLNFSSRPLTIKSMTRVGNKLFVFVSAMHGLRSGNVYSVELDGVPKVSLLEAGPCSLLVVLHLFSLSSDLATVWQMEKEEICSLRAFDDGLFKMMEAPIWTQSSILREQRPFSECCIPVNIFHEREVFMK